MHGTKKREFVTISTAVSRIDINLLVDMVLVYTHQNVILVENAKNIIEQRGIQCELRNQYLSSGFGELSGIDTWPELWVDECDFELAKQAIQPLLPGSNARDWFCRSCGESNDASFSHCWQCQVEFTPI